MTSAPRHFLDLLDHPPATLRAILDASAQMKAERARDRAAVPRPLQGKTLAMIFERPSTRTRVSFDVGMRELGGETIMLTGAEMQLGRGETIADTARVLSRYVDAIMIRILDPDDLKELADHASVPVINGLTKQSHPCQVMADILTFEEHRGPIAGKKIAWAGRLQQRAVVVDRRLGAVRFRPGDRLSRRIAALRQPDRAGAGDRRAGRRQRRPGARRERGQRGDFRLLGVDGRRGRRAAP